MKKILILIGVFLVFFIFRYIVTSIPFKYKLMYDISISRLKSAVIYYNVGFQDVTYFSKIIFNKKLPPKSLQSFKKISKNDEEFLYYFTLYQEELLKEQKDIFIKNFPMDIINEDNYYFIMLKGLDNQSLSILIYDESAFTIYEMITTISEHFEK